MNMNHPPQTWRELLGGLAERPVERQRIAEELGVTPYTVTRWVTGESEPRIHNLKKLPEVFPEYRTLFAELIQADIAPYALQRSMSSVDCLKLEVPSEYLARALAAYATTSGPFRAWSIRNLTLQQAIEQLDPDQVGMEITIVQCVPPAHGSGVRSLCERMGVGTAPWNSGIGGRLLFLGAASLSGWTVGRGEPGVVQDTEYKEKQPPIRPALYEKSVAAWPVQREGKSAGCLLVSSTQVDYFTPFRLSLIEIYANTLALSFRDEEFYELHRIALHDLSVLSQQQEYTSLTHLRERVAHLRSEQGYRLSEVEAEVLALQRMESELLDLPSER